MLETVHWQFKNQESKQYIDNISKTSQQEALKALRHLLSSDNWFQFPHLFSFSEFIQIELSP